MKLNAPDRERFMLHRLNHPILRAQNRAKTFSEPVHTLMMGTVDSEAGSIDPRDP